MTILTKAAHVDAVDRGDGRYFRAVVVPLLAVAYDALARIGPDDPARDTLERVVRHSRRDGSYDQHDVQGIVDACEEHVAGGPTQG